MKESKSEKKVDLVMINGCYDLSLVSIEAASNYDKNNWVGHNKLVQLFMILEMYSVEDRFSKVAS